eukprot:2760742-Prymnesium_polylepis.1
MPEPQRQEGSRSRGFLGAVYNAGAGFVSGVTSVFSSGPPNLSALLKEMLSSAELSVQLLERVLAMLEAGDFKTDAEEASKIVSDRATESNIAFALIILYRMRKILIADGLAIQTVDNRLIGLLNMYVSNGGWSRGDSHLRLRGNKDASELAVLLTSFMEEPQVLQEFSVSGLVQMHKLFVAFQKEHYPAQRQVRWPAQEASTAWDRLFRCIASCRRAQTRPTKLTHILHEFTEALQPDELTAEALLLAINQLGVLLRDVDDLIKLITLLNRADFRGLHIYRAMDTGLVERAFKALFGRMDFQRKASAVALPDFQHAAGQACEFFKLLADPQAEDEYAFAERLFETVVTACFCNDEIIRKCALHPLEYLCSEVFRLCGSTWIYMEEFRRVASNRVSNHFRAISLPELCAWISSDAYRAIQVPSSTRIVDMMLGRSGHYSLYVEAGRDFAVVLGMFSHLLKYNQMQGGSQLGRLRLDFLTSLRKFVNESRRMESDFANVMKALASADQIFNDCATENQHDLCGPFVQRIVDKHLNYHNPMGFSTLNLKQLFAALKQAQMMNPMVRKIIDAIVDAVADRKWSAGTNSYELLESLRFMLSQAQGTAANAFIFLLITQLLQKHILHMSFGDAADVLELCKSLDMAKRANQLDSWNFSFVIAMLEVSSTAVRKRYDQTEIAGMQASLVEHMRRIATSFTGVCDQLQNGELACSFTTELAVHIEIIEVLHSSMASFQPKAPQLGNPFRQKVTEHVSFIEYATKYMQEEKALVSALQSQGINSERIASHMAALENPGNQKVTDLKHSKDMVQEWIKPIQAERRFLTHFFMQQAEQQSTLVKHFVTKQLRENTDGAPPKVSVFADALKNVKGQLKSMLTTHAERVDFQAMKEA